MDESMENFNKELESIKTNQAELPEQGKKGSFIKNEIQIA